MKTKYFIITIFLLIGLAVFVDKIIAQESNQMPAIQYPVEELDNCENKADCKAYCDKPKNSDACLDFAQKNNLMTEQEIKVAKKFLSNEIEGPGGCTTKDSCEAYCNNINHIDECISFAENNNLIPPEELEEAKKVQAAIKKGAKPPPCGNKKQCDIYCEEPEHMEECITFGIEAGFIQGKELEDVQKMLQAVKRGVKPPPCKGREACDEYCSSPDNMEVCMTFAMEAGFMSEQEKADSQKMLQALKKGVKPPPCKGREECDAYCGQEEHFEKCMNFAVAAGFMTEEDAKMARKTGGKGPGDCKGKEECEAFCNNPDNQQTCFNFAKDNGMIPEEDLKKIEEGQQRMKESLQQAPQEVTECLQKIFGAEMVEKMKSGFLPPKETGDQMASCFQKMGPPPGREGQEMMQAGQSGPGGCKDPEECKKICENNPEECKNFQPGPGAINPGDQMMPPQAGPGGCKTPEECKSYCESNPQDCQNFQQGPGPNFQQRPSSRQQCEGENCQYGPPPCEGENCQPPQNMQPPQPCEGDNCQFGPPPQGQIPPADQQLQNFQTQPVEQQLQQNLPVEQQPPPSTEQSPPPPTSFFINPDSLVASAARALFNFLFNR